MTDENRELKALVVKSAMRKMMQQGYFDICTVRKCLDLLGIAPVNESYKMLETLHCVNYSGMEPEIRSALPRLLGDTFDGIDIEAMLGATPSAKQLAEKAGFWKRLTNGGGERAMLCLRASGTLRNLSAKTCSLPKERTTKEE